MATRERAGGPPRIGILGHVGNQNLGDESIIAAVIENIRSRWPEAEINGFTLNPGDTESRHGIKAYPIRRMAQPSQTASPPVESFAKSDAQEEPTDPSLARRVKELVKKIPVLGSLVQGSLAALETLPGIIQEIPFLVDSGRRAQGLDLLIFAGSHQLNDFVGGPWAYPYTVLKWTLLAKAGGAEVVFLSLGAGPIETWLGRRFIRLALRLASYRSYRDVTAKRVVASLKGFDADAVVPDLAFSLGAPVSPAGPIRRAGAVIGINPLPLYTDYWFIVDLDKYETYIRKLAAFADSLVERGCEVHFIPTQLKVDPAVIRDVRSRMARNGDPEFERLIVEPRIESLADLRSSLAALDVMVATRYHGIVLSLALHKPVLAIAYHDKSRDIMNWFGLGDYAIEGDTFTVDALEERLSVLEDEGSSISSEIRRQTPAFNAAVEAQYDEVFELL